MKIFGEESFGIATNFFTVGPATSNYELEFSVDNINWTSVGKETPANETHIVSSCPKNLFWHLKGNTGDVLIQY